MAWAKLRSTLLFTLILFWAHTAPASITIWVELPGPTYPFISLNQSECPFESCDPPGRHYAVAFGFADLLNGPAPAYPNVLEATGTLTVPPPPAWAYFDPYLLCCDLAGPHRVSLSTGPLVGTYPEIHVAVVREGEGFGVHELAVQLDGPGETWFMADPARPYYAIVYGAGVTGLTYNLTVSAVPEPAAYVGMLAGLLVLAIARKLQAARAQLA